MIQLVRGNEALNEANGAGFFRGMSNPRHYNISESQMDQAEDFMARMIEGRVSQAQIAEAFTTSDFKLAAFARIEQRTIEAYEKLESTWRQYTDVVKVNDFRPTRILDKWTKTNGLKLVPEGTEYPRGVERDAAQYFINVLKYGLADSITWESMINNEAIGELEDLPKILAGAAVQTETINALSNLLAVDATTNTAATVNTDFFKSGNGNAPGSVALSAQSLDTVLGTLQAKTGKRGAPQMAPELVVVVPSALRTVADRIRSLREIRLTDASGNVTVHDNYLLSTEIVVEPMLDVVLTHAKKAGTWFVLPKPGSVRPAVFAAFLRGYENVDIRVRADAGARPGGGQISPLEGSFDVDTIDYRARHVVGHQTGDPTYTYVSYGS